MYAFLFLTYDDPNKPQIWNKFFEKRPECNIYIHPKFKNRMSSTFKKYVISSHIETAWADISIVRTTLLLLEESFKNLDNEWFILCSNSCIPLYSFVKFKKYELENFTLVGQISKNTEIDSIDEEFIVDLKIELDDEFNTDIEKIEIETE